MSPYHPYLGPAVALVAGILVLIQPGLLSVIVAVYLIVPAYLVWGPSPPADGGRENGSEHYDYRPQPGQCS